MSTTAHATIGYGFLLPQKLCEDDVDSLLENKDNQTLEFTWAGNSCSDNFKTFIIIKESVVDIYSWKDEGFQTFDPAKLKNTVAWNEILETWAQKNKVNNHKIGWYFCLSV